MDVEKFNIEYKSLKKAIGDKARLRDVAETCVCLANGQGGKLYIGIEDGSNEPPAGQRINQVDLNKVVSRLRELTDSVAVLPSDILSHDNGGQYFILNIPPTTRTIATTSNGKVLIRISDNCFPVSGQELTDLAMEKTAFQWEIVSLKKIPLDNVDKTAIKFLTNHIRNTEKVSEFIKSKEDLEILEAYQLITDDGFLTNLGTLWLGESHQRARISYPISVQYIVYNDNDEKIRKVEWHDNQYNPMELLKDIERETVELTYSTEMPDGLFRKNVREYPSEVIRELLVNAIAHKKYTQSGDIFIELYPDRVEITSPGGLPLGVTASNILHERKRRNPHLIKLMSDFGLMEGEGSGYDLVYEKLAMDAKPLPSIECDFNKVKVIVKSGSINTEAVSILDYIDKHFTLKQKEYITVGIIATDKKISATRLTSKLQLGAEEKIRSWIGSLTTEGIVVTHGIKKGTQYLLNPKLVSQADVKVKPSLKTMEPYKLEALIVEDIRHNSESSMISEIQKRLKDIDIALLRRTIYKMVEHGILNTLGAKKNRTYILSKKKQNENKSENKTT